MAAVYPLEAIIFPSSDTWKNLSASEFQTGNLKNVPVHIWKKRKKSHRPDISHNAKRISALRLMIFNLKVI